MYYECVDGVECLLKFAFTCILGGQIRVFFICPAAILFHFMVFHRITLITMPNRVIYDKRDAFHPHQTSQYMRLMQLAANATNIGVQRAYSRC